MASTGLFYSPTAELQRGITLSGHRLVNGLRVPNRIGRNYAQTLAFFDDSNLYYSPTAELQRGSEFTIDHRLINNLRVPNPISRSRYQPAEIYNRVAGHSVLFYSPTADLRGRQANSDHTLPNELRTANSIINRRQEPLTVRYYGMIMEVWDFNGPRLFHSPTRVFQERHPNITSRTVNGLRVPEPIRPQEQQASTATHRDQADPSGTDEVLTPQLRLMYLCAMVDIGLNRLHDPFTFGDRKILNHLVAFLGYRKRDLETSGTTADSNAEEVRVPENKDEVAELVCEGIRTLDYPYLLRVMNAIEVLANGIWQYVDDDEAEANKENIPPHQQ
ncbi:hypothetical protein EsH8_VI_001105 [Colletotrichum jinshuiense]